MNRHAILPVLTAAMMGLYSATAEAQTDESYVSGNGSDANPTCTFQTPCRTFDNALGKTAAKGTIFCRDSSTFGILNITKSITIDCAGGTFTTGVISVTGTNIVVKLRNLTVTPSAGSNAAAGIFFVQGAMLHLHNVIVDRFTAFDAVGIMFLP